MYKVFVVFQFVSLCLYLLIFFIVANKRPSRVQTAGLLLVTSLCMMALASYIEMTTSSPEIMAAMIRLVLMSTCAISASTLWFCAAFCRLRIPKWIYFIQYILIFIAAFSALAINYRNLLFTDFSAYYNGYFTQCSFKPGPVCILLYTNILAILGYSTVRCAIELRESVGLDRKRIIWVLIGLVIPFFLLLSGLLDVTGDLILGPLSHFVEMLCFFFAFVRYGYFDTVQAASENFLLSGNEGFAIISAKQRVLMMNPVAQTLLPHLKTGKTVNDDELVSEILNKSRKTVTLNDRVFDVRVEPIIERGFHQGVLLWFIDMTENYRYIADMERLTKQADAANMAKSDFLSSMSHEIRTPMNAVLGMNKMILRESKDKNILGYAQNIERAGSALLGIINDILDIAKIENGELALYPTEYSLSSLLNDIFNLAKWRAQEKGLDIRLSVTEGIPDLLFGDKVRVRQAITNIIGNAVKYTSEGYVELAVTAKSQDKPTGGIILCFSVTDTGIGIQKEDQEKLFKNFVRLDDIKNRAVEGTGLGLAITGRLVDIMGGTLGVDSEYGKGSRFFMEIPQQVHDMKPIGKIAERLMMQSTSPDTPTFFAPDKSVLIVDDNEMNLLVASELLRRTGMRVTTATSGRECLHLMEQNRYSVLLLDHMMPELDGVETLHRLKQLDLLHGTPVIALTANAVIGAKEQYLALGFDDYVPKSVEPKYMEAVIARQLKRREKNTITEAASLPLTILALEDDTKALTDLRQAARGICRVVPVRSVEQAQAYLAKNMPDAVLCGKGLAEAADRKIGPRLRENRVPTVLVTDKNSLPPADGLYLSKPVKESELLAVLKELRPGG
ncbi:MAG: response regulator [Clostridia bacterium]|nr:response regulator [Clostridia bacterium]